MTRPSARRTVRSLLTATTVLTAAVTLTTTAPAAVDQPAGPAADARDIEMPLPVAIPGELVIAFSTAAEGPFDLRAELTARGLDWADDAANDPAARRDVDAGGADRRAELQPVDGARLLLRWTPRNADQPLAVALIRVPVADTDAAAAALAARPDIAWVAPNRAILEDPREYVPNDPQYGSQYHHPLMQNDDAWDITLGHPSIVVAITDDGVDLDHEDLEDNIWVNPTEIPGNGFDDDGNGYTDDVNGWDVLNDNNDPNPEGSNEHGTHVAGISAADTDNGIGVAGVAGRARIMPIQFFTGGQPWTAANIAEAFGYAAANGANIVNTSYNMDGWAGDPVVTAGYDMMYDNDVLHFNSAGNGGSLNPPRQIFHQTFLVVNTDSNDVKAGSSNYGTGVDVSAPGSSVLSTELNSTYGTKSGTSMAAPNAAGVAALVWTVNPSWTRDQVVAQVLGTADDIDAQNPSFAGLMGSGRVNSFRALTETLPAPQLVSVEGAPEDGATQFGELDKVVFRFDQLLDPATVDGGDGFILVGSGPDGMFDTADDLVVSAPADEYLVGANEITVRPESEGLPAGMYRLEASGSALANPFGTLFDGDGDGMAGGSWSVTFTYCTGTVLFAEDFESVSGWTVQNTSIDDGAWDTSPEVPVGGGDRSDPATDFDGSGRCFLTDNTDGNSDVDGGPTRLLSPELDLTGMVDPWIEYARWFVTDDFDVFEVHASDDGGASWTLVESIDSTSGWNVARFRVAELFPATPSALRLRFTANDNPNDSVVEAAIDRLRILTFTCETDPGIPADLDGDGNVGLNDLLIVLSSWGACPMGDPCPADLDGDGNVGLNDLVAVLASWS